MGSASYGVGGGALVSVTHSGEDSPCSALERVARAGALLALLPVCLLCPSSAFASGSGAIAGDVVDNLGLPAPGVCVTARSRDITANEFGSARTDGSGNYTITGLA